jgi:hypothetical protein
MFSWIDNLIIILVEKYVREYDIIKMILNISVDDDVIIEKLLLLLRLFFGVIIYRFSERGYTIVDFKGNFYTVILWFSLRSVCWSFYIFVFLLCLCFVFLV